MAKTGYITVFSNQAVIFNHPKDYNTKVTIKAFDFEEVPEWVLQSTMFKLLTKSNKIRVIESKADISTIDDVKGKLDKMAVSDAIDAVEANESVTEVSDDVETTIDYTHMKSKELYDICVEKGIEVEAKQPKDYYIEKLNA